MDISRFIDGQKTSSVTSFSHINDSSNTFLKTPSLDVVDSILANQNPQLSNASEYFKVSNTKLVSYGDDNQKTGPLMILNQNISNYHEKKTETLFKFKLWQE